jgi:hypothetical protein
VKRDYYGPVDSGMATVKISDLCDVFTCPHAGKDWHEKAWNPLLAIEGTPSNRLATLMRFDLDDLLKENGVQ